MFFNKSTYCYLACRLKRFSNINCFLSEYFPDFYKDLEECICPCCKLKLPSKVSLFQHLMRCRSCRLCLYQYLSATYTLFRFALLQIAPTGKKHVYLICFKKFDTKAEAILHVVKEHKIDANSFPPYLNPSHNLKK